MQGVELLGAGLVLLGTVVVGLIVHELAHAVVLHGLNIPYDIRWFPGRQRSSRTVDRICGTWASVTPRHVPARAPVWGIQLSALAPLLLTLPFLLVVFGVRPGPSVANSPYFVAWAVAWLGCSLPSPQDFSVFWYADTVLSEKREPRPSND